MGVNKPTATWRHWGAMKMIQVETAQSTPANGKNMEPTTSSKDIQ